MNNINAKMQMCAYADNCECLILTEKICLQKQCSFFKSREQYEKDRKRDFLFEYYKKGRINRGRYLELCKLYSIHKKPRFMQNEV